ncbi:hypothetical protein NG895_12055, partial [Aeoliella sp. ICT_H6.2]
MQATMSRKELMEMRAEALATAKSINENLTNGDGSLDARDQKRYDELMAAVEGYSAKIEAIEGKTRDFESLFNGATGGGSVLFKTTNGKSVRGFKHGEKLSGTSNPSGAVA